MARRCGQACTSAMRQGDIPDARACNTQPDCVIRRIDARKIRAGHAHPAIPIRPKVNRIEAPGLVFSGNTARRIMNRKIHGNERQSVVNPETA